MALLNGLYVHAISETIDHAYNKTNNPVEEGVDVTDHIERNLVKLKIDGEVIDTPTLTASKMYSQLVIWANNGTLIEFRGRNVFDGVITSVSKVSDAEISNGAKITIDFEEMRIANSLYTEPKANAGTQQVQSTKNTGKEVWHTVQKGEWLLKIARKYNTTLEWILANNKLKSGNPNLIYPGEKILVSKNGVPNTSTVSASKPTTTKKTNIAKTTKQAAKTVAKISTTQGGGGQSGGSGSSDTPNYVVTEPTKQFEPIKLTEPKKQKTTLTTYKIPSTYADKILDKISRMRVYVKYFKTTYPDRFLPYYTLYVGWVEYALNVIEGNMNKNKYSREIAIKLVSYCSGALDKCDKAKLKIDNAVNVYEHQDTAKGLKEAQKATPYIKAASDLLHEYMNETDKNS